MYKYKFLNVMQKRNNKNVDISGCMTQGSCTKVSLKRRLALG